MSVAVVFDVSSIQKYIFGSNRLRESFGASYIITHLYDPLIRFINETGNNCNGYIGGGNALIIFDEQEKIDNAENIIREFTLNVLRDYPGLEIAVGINKNFSRNNERGSVKQLFNDLLESKNAFSPITIIPTHGITVECASSGYGADYRDGKENINYISHVTLAKLDKTKRAGKEVSLLYLKENKYCDKLDKEFAFSDDLSEIGQSKGEDSHIAVVHIDGNNMSSRFRDLDSIKEMKRLSDSVKEVVRDSFMQLICSLAEDMKNLKENNSEFALTVNEESGRTILPLRPLVIAGDDVNFVSDGRMGIYLAYKFLEILSRKELSDGKKISACAGVSIVRTKYPFYRAYIMAEELCLSAKEARLKKLDANEGLGLAQKDDVDPEENSFIDFQVFYGGMSGSIENIRKRHFESNAGKLYMRPYDLRHMKELIKLVREMKRFPGSTIKGLRDILSSAEGDRSDFIRHMQYRKRILPNEFMKSKYIDVDNNKLFFINSETPYLDVIEMIDILPKFVIERGSI